MCSVFLVALCLVLSACSFTKGTLGSGDPTYDKYLKLTRDQADKNPLIGIWQGSESGKEILLAVHLNDDDGREKLKGVILNGSDYELGYVREDPWFYVSPMADQAVYAGRTSYKILFWPRWFPTKIVMNGSNQFTAYDDIPPHVKTQGGNTHVYLRKEAQMAAIDDLMRSSGSGFLLWESNKVLTAHHVVKQAKKLSVRFPDGSRYEADITASDPANDLALLTLRGFSSSPGRGLHILQGVPVAPGEEIHVIGYPLGALLGDRPSIVSGQVSASVGIRNAENQFRITASINPGTSGGPILNSRGEVIGVAVSTVRQQQIERVAFGVKIGTSIPMLGDALQKGSLLIRQPMRAEEIFQTFSRDVVFIMVE
jgi:hypothetical protein